MSIIKMNDRDATIIATKNVMYAYITIKEELNTATISVHFIHRDSVGLYYDNIDTAKKDYDMIFKTMKQYN